MSEQKKPKIDLKARLGKKSVGAPTGAAIPPPVGIPKPPVMGGAPGADPTNPYAAMAEPAPRVVKPQAIKVEMSEEVVAQQKKTQQRGYIITGVVGVLMMGLGFTWGGSSERGKGTKAALEGARELIKEVEAADKVADELNTVLAAAAEKLGKSEFPEAEISQLGGINIPFDGGHLTDKSIGRFKRDIVTMLINYANNAQKANEQKEKIQSLLSGSKAGITELLQQKTDPKIRWSAIVVGGPGGPWATMQPFPAPFLVKSDKKVKDADGKEKDYEWPAELKVGNETVKRYKSGDISSGAQFVPVNPTSEAAVCPSTTVVRLRQELMEMQTVLKGDNTPGAEKTGLLQLGETVVTALKKIGTG